MDKNEMVAKYEEALREAEKAMDKVNGALWNLRGPFPRGDIREVTERIQEMIRNCWKFYDNDEVEVAD